MLCKKCTKEEALVNESYCEDCWAEEASTWMWRGPSDCKPRSNNMIDTLDCRVLGINRHKLRKFYGEEVKD